MKNIIQVSILLLTSLSVIFLNGCSGDSEKSTKSTSAKVATASSIEIVQNDNASETKVKLKDHNTSQDKSYYFDYGVKSAYAQDAQPANKDALVRMKPRTSIDANMHVRSPYEEVKVSLMVRRLSKKFIVKCSACHNDYANGVIGPSLLSKSSDFIFEKIMKFKKDRNLNILMSDLVANMSNKEIREIADEIFRFNTEIKNMRNK